MSRRVWGPARLPTELLYMSALELGPRLREGEFSSRALTEAYLERLESVGEDLNAVVTTTRERALREADRADEELAAGEVRSPLHGVPYGVKDLIAAQGYPTTWGAEPFREQRLGRDAAVVMRLEAAGAVLVAKLATVELAGGMGYEQADAAFTGPGINPWNPDAWSGGSSSGPASAVAAGLVGFALGTETSGSIVTPAAFSGVSGLRPTYGRVSRFGTMTLVWSMDKVGPMARSAADCEAVLRAIAGPDPEDPTAADRELPEGATLPGERPRLAVLQGTGLEEQPGVRENFARSLEVLGEFATLDQLTLPDLPYNAVGVTIMASESAAAFEDLVESGEVERLTAPEDRVKPYAGHAILAKDYINAMRIRRKMQAALDESLAPFDAVVGPTRATVANPLDRRFAEYFGEFGGTSFIGPANLAGMPAVTVPNGFAERGLPTGLQFTGRAWDEPKLLALAQEYQSRTDWHRRFPDL